jgi:hypothetical protein
MRTWTAAALACVLLSACGDGPADAARSAATSDAVTLYEGLPHQGFEEKLLESELAKKPVVRWGGFPFYAGSIAPSAADAARLRELLSAESTFEPWSGEKKCGGFHPDWAVEIGTGDAASRALVCFGCEEIKLLKGGSEERFDVADAAEKALVQVLGAYRKNRPPSEK